MFWSEGNRYSACAHYVRHNYECPYQRDVYGQEPDELGWCGKCMASNVDVASSITGSGSVPGGHGGEGFDMEGRSSTPEVEVLGDNGESGPDTKTPSDTNDDDDSETGMPLCPSPWPESTYLYPRHTFPTSLSSDGQSTSSSTQSCSSPSTQVSETCGDLSPTSSTNSTIPHPEEARRHRKSAPAQFQGRPLHLQRSLRSQRHREACRGYQERVKKMHRLVADELGVSMHGLYEMIKGDLDEGADRGRRVRLGRSGRE
ncbi:hypothetical protein BDW02DRAFT_425450 [Decorospora gaudefroyi]|uniref:Uncharacterized protein n=1 Tax=Decorospora gaudefroyi TaxID=184978 RepID=A0A6A5K850_9PLEO|nr:hypothetical protein BDW02DRAFT_425450 [Decorospora gaudefroyi]